MKEYIIIKTWTGRVLFRGHREDSLVDTILDANRCECDNGCIECDGTKYVGDFEVFWEDNNDDRNVYECINY